MLKDPEIQKCRLRRDENGDDFIKESRQKNVSNDLIKSKGESSKNETSTTTPSDVPDDIHNFIEKMEGDDEDENETLQTVSFEVKQEEIENLQRQCILLEYPLLAEYDFKNDTLNPNIK